MRLLRLRVDGFGALRGEFVFDPERVTIVIDENERGKSTMLAAICAALYGLDGDRRTHRVLTPLERYRPWEGGRFGVELELATSAGSYVVRRDFERGTVEVWDGQGREVTADFRDGRDDFPVGARLLGLDAEEFARCAFVRQGELDEVVPADEKARRTSTLAARLENAADTRVGDTNASEALRVLEGALRKYTCPEVETSGLVDNAIQKLEIKRGLLDTELKSLEHDLELISEPIDELARLREEESDARTGIVALDDDRRVSLVAGLRRQLVDQARTRGELEKLERAAETLAPAAQLPPNAEAQLHEAVARYEEAQRSLQALETRRRDETQRERAVLERELAELSKYQHFTPEDADACMTLAAELRRITADDSRLRDEVFRVRESLASRGHDPERFHWLEERLGKLEANEQRLLRRQSELALAFQTDVARLEQERTVSSETLREIDSLRSGRRLPGGALVALGAAALLGGGVVLALEGPALWSQASLGGGGLLVGAGIALLASAGSARRADRDEALRGLGDAQRKLNQLRTSRAETEVGLGELSVRMGYRDQVELLREWNEYARMLDESAPALRAQEQLATLEERRREVNDRARTFVERVGSSAPDPAVLDRIATSARKLHALYQRGAELERKWSWIDDEKRVTEAAAAGLKERAVRILQSAGLGHDPERSWADHGRELAERMKGRTRYNSLIEEFIPGVKKRLLPQGEVAELQRQLAMLEVAADEGSGEQRPRRGAAEVDSESRRLREVVDQIQKKRSDLRVQVEEIWRRFHAEHPEKVGQRERVGRALEKARRFKAAVELARETISSVATETHRRWAEFLNQRVSELLAGTGTRIEQLRFGDDLDFSVRLAGGQQLTRGKADLQLSAGARDQLYLAVRLAVSEYLSRADAHLPMLLDDVFESSDDERTRLGMRSLIEHFAPDHQIVLLTCHRSRFEALARLDSELYESRVQWLPLTAVSNLST